VFEHYWQQIAEKQHLASTFAQKPTLGIHHFERLYLKCYGVALSHVTHGCRSMRDFFDSLKHLLDRTEKSPRADYFTITLR
jgi:hypothetical protein